MASSRGLDPDGVDGIPGTRGGPDRAFLAGAAAAFFALLLAAELAARLAVGSGLLYRRIDFSGTLTSLPELRDRIAWNASRPRPVFVLGDSVLGASALFEHRVPRPRRHSVPAFLVPAAAAAGLSVVSLAADGLLLPDLAAIAREIRRAPPARLLVVLNVRMFAPEFADPAKSIARDFLIPALARPPAADGVPVRPQTLEDGLAEWSARISCLARTAWQLQPLWYFPTRRDAFRRLLEPEPGEASRDVEEAALHLKVDPYYRGRWDPASPAFRALAALLDEARGREAAVVVLTPQNPDFVSDRETFAANRRVLGAFLAARNDPFFVFLDLADAFPSDRFLDHCHLTPAGNREYAETLLRSLRS